MRKLICSISLFLCALSVLSLSAQEKYIPFKAGEVLSYDMYFKYALINAKAGSSSLTVLEDVYDGRPALKMTLHAKSSGAVKGFFPVADTLVSYLSENMLPLAFYKDAHEGKDHTIEEAIYSYLPDQVQVKTRRVRNDIQRFDTTLISSRNVYDMLSILYYVRILNYDLLIKEGKTTVSYISGKKMGEMDIEYRGTETVKANDGRKYKCIKLIMSLNDDAFENKNEAMRVYITDDPNRVPIRVDTKLKRGTMRIMLRDYEGLGL